MPQKLKLLGHSFLKNRGKWRFIRVGHRLKRSAEPGKRKKQPSGPECVLQKEHLSKLEKEGGLGKREKLPFCLKLVGSVMLKPLKETVNDVFLFMGSLVNRSHLFPVRRGWRTRLCRLGPFDKISDAMGRTVGGCE